MRPDGTLQVVLGESTVEVPPGGRATVRADVVNPTSASVSARVRVTGRAASWLSPVDGGDLVDVPPGGTRTVTLSARPPAVGAAGELVPFVVRVDGGDGGRASATGLVVLVSRQRVTVSLTPGSVTSRRTARYTVEVRGGGEPCVVALRPSATGKGPQLWLDAPTLAVPAEGTVTVGLTARAARPALLAPVRHDVGVDWELLDGAEARGTARAVLRQRPLLPLPVTVLVLLAVFLGAVVGARALLGNDPVPFDLPFGASGGVGPTAEQTAVQTGRPADPVDLPYVQVGAVPQGPDPEESRTAAQERADELAAAGVPGVRVVSGADLPNAEPGAQPFWALVRDGFADIAAAAAFCEEHRAAVRGPCVPSG